PREYSQLHHVVEPVTQVLRERLLGWIDIAAFVEGSDRLGQFLLSSLPISFDGLRSVRSLSAGCASDEETNQVLVLSLLDDLSSAASASLESLFHDPFA